MSYRRRTRCVATCAALLLPVSASAQSVNITRGILDDQPYTLIYPADMIASGGGADPLTINHPDAPLQCELAIVAVGDTDWTPQQALVGFDEAAAAAEWSRTFPGFSITAKTIAPYQNGEALIYEGRSEDSPMDIPITLVHAEAVDAGRGYVLDCFYASEVESDARPLVDFIVSNFSTRSDADCCIGAQPTQSRELTPPQ